MDIRTRLAQAMHQVMSAKSTGSSGADLQKLSESQLAKTTQLALDQFAKTRTDFIKQMGAYSQQGENLKSLALLLKSGESTATDFMRELSRLISDGISRNFTALFNQQQSEAYITALLIQSFGMLDKKIKVYRRKKGQQEKDEQKQLTEEQILAELDKAETSSIALLEGLLKHAENHANDLAFFGWAQKSVEITKQQLNAQQIPINDGLEQQFEVVQDVIIALQNGMSVAEIRKVIATSA
jgi:hypothetical protein